MRTIAHISDLHFGKLDPPVAEGLVADLAKMKPSVLVVSGDFTQRAREGQFRDAAAFLERLPTPRVVVPGNHDVPMYNVFRRFFRPLSKYRRIICRDLRPVFQDEELIVLGINTARSFTHKSGWISSEQLLDVRMRVCDLPANVVKVVVTHHPFIPPPRERQADVIRGGKKYVGELATCGVDLLLAGHLHLAYHDDLRSHYKSAKRSILSIQAGTATSTRRRGEPNAYNWITVSPDRCTVSVRVWNGKAFKESLVTRYRRVENVWTRETQTPLDETAEQVLTAHPTPENVPAEPVKVGVPITPPAREQSTADE